MTEETTTAPFTHQQVFPLCTDNKSLNLKFPDATLAAGQNKADTTCVNRCWTKEKQTIWSGTFPRCLSVFFLFLFFNGFDFLSWDCVIVPTLQIPSHLLFGTAPPKNTLHLLFWRHGPYLLLEKLTLSSVGRGRQTAITRQEIRIQ